MKSPCESCLVQTSCTKVCDDRVEYIYENKEYQSISEDAAEKINNMSYEQAIPFIRDIENMYRLMKYIM